jgi:hypothetical protein
LQAIARELLVDLRRRFDHALVLLDLLFHPGEGFEGRLLGQTGHRFGDALLRLRPTLAREQQVLLALGLFDLVVEVTQGVLELLGLELVRLPRGLELLGVRVVLALPDEGLLGEVVAPLLDGEHRLLLPVLRLLVLRLELVAQPLFVGDGGGDLLLGLHQLVAHVNDDLVQHLLRIFGGGDHVVDVRLDE